MSDIYDLADLLQLIVTERAEGLILQTGKPPVVELRGISHTIEGPVLSPENADILLRGLAGTRGAREIHDYGRTRSLYTYRDAAQFQVEAHTDGEQVLIELRRVGA